MVGQNIGKYRVLDRVGRGGMGTVYRAIDETLHREVAIKVLNAELNDPEVARRFRAEAITVARLSHPGIATIYELFQHEGQWLMVMEFVRGETLEGMVSRLGALSADKAAELCMQSLAALAHAHSMGVVHRDLKPANIMVTESGTVKIMDFGIARVAGTEHLTNVGFMMGTPAYMAPEQVLGQDIDARADVYAMGVVFYRLVTAQLPFKGETPFAMAQAQVNNPPTPVRSFRADLPVWVEDVMVRSLAKKPDDRFPSALAFHEGFARCLSGHPIDAPYSSSAPTGLMSTPPRAMPNESADRTMLGTPVSLQMPLASPQASMPNNSSEMAPTMVGTPVGTVRPPTQMVTGVGEGVSSSPEDRTGTATGIGTEAIKAPTAPMAAASPASPVMTAAMPAPAVPAVPAQPASKVAVPAKTGGSMGLMAAAAAVVVVLGATGAFVWHSRQAPPASVQEPPVADAVAQPDVPPPAAPAPNAGTTPATADPAARGTTPAAPGAPGTPPPATAPRGAAPAVAPGTPVPDAGRAAAVAGSKSTPLPAARPVDETHIALTDVKLLTVNGKKTKDQDVLVNFVGGQLSVLQKNDSIPVSTWPYRDLLRATYVKARDPKWDTTFASPPDGLDVGGVLRTSKHWVVLQNRDSYMILRMSDSNYARMIETIESRSGIQVARPQADSDKK